jgi:membrane protein
MSVPGHKPPLPSSPFSRGLSALDDFLQRVFSKGGRAGRYIHMAHLLVVNIRRTQLTRMAAALSYRTIFGLIPILVVGLLLLTVFASREQIGDTLDSLLSFTGFKEVIEGAPIEDSELTGPSPDVAEHVAEQSRRLNMWIQERYENIRKIPSGAIGVVSIITLFYAAISMLIEIEKAFNQIYNAPEGRSWIRRVTQYWTLLTLGTLLLVASFYVQRMLTQRAETAHVWGLTSDHMKIFARSLGFLLTVFISMTALFIIYLIVPNTRVQVVPALIGAATAAILWESGKWGFTAYIGFATRNLQRLYGAIAILPLFFLWVYITWMIVLLGLQLASALQTQRVTGGKEFKFSLLATFGLVDEDALSGRVKIVDPAAALVCITAVAERFAAGKTSDHASIAARTGIDEQAVSEMLERLAGAGLLVRVENPSGESAYTLARPPELTPAADVLAISQELVSVRSTHIPLLDSLAQARIQAVAGKSVADLMEKPDPAEIAPIIRPAEA